MDKRNSIKIKDLLYPGIVFLLFFAFWEMLVILFGINPIILPAPSNILITSIENINYLIANFLITLFESVVGFALAFVVSFILSITFVYSKNTKTAFYPFAIALKATPLVAIAPLIVLWFGANMLPMIIMAALVAFFPILVNSVEGFEQVEQEKIDLFKIYKASSLREFFKLRLPIAMPFIFSALKISSTLAVVGAIIGEMTGSGAGLGFVIVNASYYLDVPLMFAAILFSSVWGIIFFLIVALMEKKAIFFQRLSTKL